MRSERDRNTVYAYRLVRLLLAVAACATALVQPAVQAGEEPNGALVLENDVYRIAVSRASGAITSFFVRPMDCELIGEPRLAENFRICLPLEDYQANYIDGMQQRPAAVDADGKSVTVRFSGMSSEKGRFQVDLTYTIALDDTQVRFSSKLTNRDSRPISEFWFPRLGGWTRFGKDDGALLATPGYGGCRHGISLFKHFPGGMGLGSEAAEWSVEYPGMVMPWWSLRDAASNRSLYMGYHDATFRLSSWHTYLWPTSSGSPGRSWLTPEQAGGRPVGLIFSHVRYPFIKAGETFTGGEFIVRLHEGDWHQAAKFYRGWFMEHFPFDKSRSWLRKQSAWFTSIIYQPEDRIVADFKTYGQWAADAQRFGINTFELIGWHTGGLERGYPNYVAEPKLGGHEGFRRLIADVHQRGGRILPFVNYNILDSATEQYRSELKPFTHQDGFGATPNWMAWGESTLLARKGLNVRRHLLASVVPPIQKLLEGHFVQIAKDGADGLQIDKLVVSTPLDFNPLNKLKPDEALNQGLVDAIASALEKCREINPDFCLAGEALQDRLIPYIDVYYRAAGGYDISPLRYAFPEWTACMHVSAPRDFNAINSAVMLGAVTCVEPMTYQASLADPLYAALAEYLKEVERIREQLKATIFLGEYLDMLEANVTEVSLPKSPATKSAPPAGPDGDLIVPAGSAELTPIYSGAMFWRVHRDAKTGKRAIVVINTSQQDRFYTWKFMPREATSAALYAPFQGVRDIKAADAVRIKGERFHIVVEP